MRPDRPVVLSREKRIELIQYLTEKRMEYLKCFSDRLPIVQQYIVGKMELHAHLIARNSTTSLCIRYWDKSAKALGWLKSELPVFVTVGNTIEESQNREAVVRLEALNQCDLFDGEELQRRVLTAFDFFKVIWAVADRKLCEVLLGGSIVTSEIEDDVIERRAGMVQELTDKTNRFIVDAILEVKQELRSIRLRLTNREIDGVLVGNLNERFQLVELFPCPPYPDLGLTKEVAHRRGLL
jgi:hypothetical protein